MAQPRKRRENCFCHLASSATNVGSKKTSNGYEICCQTFLISGFSSVWASIESVVTVENLYELLMCPGQSAKFLTKRKIQ
mmetsp:Transcript_20760/g.43201  ORF Transcript_20760/g.43201 Transcript_20760/m.43201 type:complete len:80 (+) Transcript_20760:1222-1461(+)